jgi:pyridoxal 5'-phosphate synthase pdxT subunit
MPPGGSDVGGRSKTIGVLALQGDFFAHACVLERAGLQPRPVRQAADLEGLEGIVLPGGESTTQLRLLGRHGLQEPLRAFVAGGAPVLATCAGLVLAAREVESPAQPSFGFLDVVVARNAWGRQLESFEARADDGLTELVFIRAPRILRVGPEVEVLATFDGEPVMVRQGRVVGATFHPELVAGAEIHGRVFC